MGLQIQVFNVSTSREIDAAFATFVRERPDAVFVGIDTFFNNRRAQLVNLASRHAVPATFSNRDFAEVGGLISYGANPTDAHPLGPRQPVRNIWPTAGRRFACRSDAPR